MFLAYRVCKLYKLHLLRQTDVCLKRITHRRYHCQQRFHKQPICCIPLASHLPQCTRDPWSVRFPSTELESINVPHRACTLVLAPDSRTDAVNTPASRCAMCASGTVPSATGRAGCSRSTSRPTFIMQRMSPAELSMETNAHATNESSKSNLLQDGNDTLCAQTDTRSSDARLMFLSGSSKYKAIRSSKKLQHDVFMS